MRGYHVKEEVPWKEVTKILYWYLCMNVRHIWNQQERGDERPGQLMLPELRQSYETVRSLRRFLGYPGSTKWDREAAKLLEYETQEP